MQPRDLLAVVNLLNGADALDPKNEGRWRPPGALVVSLALVCRGREQRPAGSSRFGLPVLAGTPRWANSATISCSFLPFPCLAWLKSLKWKPVPTRQAQLSGCRVCSRIAIIATTQRH